MNKKIVILLILAILIAAGVYFKWHSRQQADIIGQTVAPTAVHNIDKLTAQQNVVNYLRQYHRLPDFYITKRKARQSGWDPRAGNLCQVVPGKAIGGDRYNTEKNCYLLLQIANGMKPISIITVVIELVIDCFIHQMD